MNARSWHLNRTPIGLAGLAVCVLCCVPHDYARAQEYGPSVSAELRRLPHAASAERGDAERGQAPSIYGVESAPFAQELRRLPPVESLTSEPLLPADAVSPGEPISLTSFDAPVTDLPEVEELAEDRCEEPLTIVLPGYVSGLPYAPFGRPYNYEGSGAPEQSSWILGTGDRMGVFTLGFTQHGWWRIGENHFQFNPVVRFVSGPKKTDMPPQLYEFDISFVRRDNVLSPSLSYEVALRVGFFADFEGSAREGLRFPGHAVLFYQVSEQRQLIVGIDYLDRDDVVALPVVGAAFSPHPDFWIEAIFPKPRVALRIHSHRWLYLAARLGGGTWAIERKTSVDDVVNYRDYQIVLGIQQDHAEGHVAFLEIGYVFDRQLEYRSGSGNYGPRNTAILRSVLRY